MTRRLLVVGLLILGATTAQAQVFHPQTATLANGLQVIVLPNHRAPVVTQMLWYKAGAAFDPQGASGIAHFLEHLNFKGTKNHPEGEYSKIISHLGGTENAFTSYDYTAYYATFGKQHLPIVMAMEADRLQNWKVTDAQVAAERKVILKERQQTVDNNPVVRFWEKVHAMLYGDHPYHRPVLGWKNEMEKLDRAVAEQYHGMYYTPGNAILVLSGDVTLDEVRPLIDKNFGPITSRTVTSPRFEMPQAPAETMHLHERSAQVRETVWSQHYLVPPARPQNIATSDALLVLNKILGDSRTGRLYRRLVVKDKIATSASAHLDLINVGPADWSITVTPQPGVDTNRIAQAVKDEIHMLLDKGVTKDEVQDATQALEIESVYARDAVTGPAMIVGRALVSGLDVATIEDWPRRMRRVSAKGVNEQAKHYLSQPPRLTAVLSPEVK